MKSISTLILFLASLAPYSIYAQPSENEHIKAELVSEVESVQPGQPFSAGVRLKMNEGWHTYWREAGDSGFPPSINWKLPEGWEASPINWPIPQKSTVEGLVNFTYKNEILLLVEITPPLNLELDKSFTLSANVSWLACKLSCIPGTADLELTLPVKESTPVLNPEEHAAFQKARENLPQISTHWKIDAYTHKNLYGLLIEPVNKQNSVKLPKSVQFFSYDNNIQLNKPQVLQEAANGYFLELPISGDLPNHLQGILINPEGWLPEGKAQALAIDIKELQDKPIVLSSDTKSSISLSKALLLAFLGGLVLNLMPCVFPILGLKVMSFVKYAGESPWKARMHGLTFTLGVLVSFWALSGLLLILRAGGEQLGWGFQLQSPFFITFLCFLLLLLALNFLGTFEMGLSLMSAGGKLSNHSGYSGTFLSGILATVLATPCTAPFMGTALGFALAQPASFSLAIFTSLALGMAAPYLILTLSPTLLKYLPRPGPWMETFKQMMAFPLLATVVWLLWVFGHQTHHDALTKLLFGLLLASIAAWIYGRFATFNASPQKRHLAQIISILFLTAGIYLGYTSAKVDPTLPTDPNLSNLNEHQLASKDLVWEQFSSERLQELQAEGRPIFIDFTAAWCLNCQINKKNVFSSEKVIKTFKEKNIALLHADWTKKNPEITKALQSYNRSGVPTNIYYPAGKDSEPMVLPELLTPNTVLEILN